MTPTTSRKALAGSGPVTPTPTISVRVAGVRPLFSPQIATASSHKVRRIKRLARAGEQKLRLLVFVEERRSPEASAQGFNPPPLVRIGAT